MVVKRKSNTNPPFYGIQKVSEVPLSRGPGNAGERRVRWYVPYPISGSWVSLGDRQLPLVAGSSSYAESLSMTLVLVRFIFIFWVSCLRGVC